MWIFFSSRYEGENMRKMGLILGIALLLTIPVLSQKEIPAHELIKLSLSGLT